MSFNPYHGQYPESYHSAPNTPLETFQPWDQLDPSDPNQAQHSPQSQVQEQQHSPTTTGFMPTSLPPSSHIIQQQHSRSTCETNYESRSPPSTDLVQPLLSTASRPKVHNDSSALGGPVTLPRGPGTSSLVQRRSPTSRTHFQSAFPYRRPQSAMGTAPVVTTSRQRGPSDQRVRFSASTGHAVHSMTAAGVGISNIAGPSSLRADLPQEVSRTSSEPIHSSASSPMDLSVLGIPSASMIPNDRPIQRYNIRADSNFDADSKVFSAVLELPGVKREDVNLSLSTCIYNGVRQITISGRSTPTLPLSGAHSVRERKYGDYSRTFTVPTDTKVRQVRIRTHINAAEPEHVDAVMADGLLILRVHCPSAPDEVEEPMPITIRPNPS